MVAILLFSMGAGVSIYEGVQKLLSPHPIEHAFVNYAVLGVAIAFELASTYVALGEFNARRGEMGPLLALRSSKDPAPFTVVLVFPAERTVSKPPALPGRLLPEVFRQLVGALPPKATGIAWRLAHAAG